MANDDLEFYGIYQASSSDADSQVPSAHIMMI